MDDREGTVGGRNRGAEGTVIPMIEIRQARGQEAIDELAALARLTWERHYVPIIGQSQTTYMISRFQSAEAIGEQMAKGYEYYLMQEGRQPLGYIALLPDCKGGTALLSKIYVHPDWQRKGVGRWIIAWVESYCQKRQISALWLTVNKRNSGSIAFYERVGFINAGSLIQEIGGGFVMDDYKMVKTLVARGHLPPF